MSERGAELGGTVADAPPVAHSIVEERLFLLTIRCECGAGPLGQVAQAIARQEDHTFDVVTTRCPSCSRERQFRFDVTGFFGRFYPRRAVSDRREPSVLLDRVAWVRWARLYLRAFADGPAGPARPLGAAERIDCGVLALRCLDEALKFNDGGEEALFSAGSAAAFREAPERYQRVEILGLKLQAAMMLAGAGVNPDSPDGAAAGANAIVGTHGSAPLQPLHTSAKPAAAGSPALKLLAPPAPPIAATAPARTRRPAGILAAIAAAALGLLAIAYAVVRALG